MFDTEGIIGYYLMQRANNGRVEPIFFKQLEDAAEHLDQSPISVGELNGFAVSVLRQRNFV